MNSKDEPSLADLWRETHGRCGAVQVFMAKLAELGSGSSGAGGPDEDERQVLMHSYSIEGVGCNFNSLSVTNLQRFGAGDEPDALRTSPNGIKQDDRCAAINGCIPQELLRVWGRLAHSLHRDPEFLRESLPVVVRALAATGSPPLQQAQLAQDLACAGATAARSNDAMCATPFDSAAAHRTCVAAIVVHAVINILSISRPHDHPASHSWHAADAGGRS